MKMFAIELLNDPRGNRLCPKRKRHSASPSLPANKSSMDELTGLGLRWHQATCYGSERKQLQPQQALAATAGRREEGAMLARPQGGLLDGAGQYRCQAEHPIGQ